MLKIIERAWIVIGAIGIVGFIYKSLDADSEFKQKDQIYFIVFTVVAGLMYAIRRRQRKYAEKVNSNNKPQQ